MLLLNAAAAALPRGARIRSSVAGLTRFRCGAAGPLFAWFTERGYTFIPHFYGNPSNNYMGVCIRGLRRWFCAMQRLCAA